MRTLLAAFVAALALLAFACGGSGNSPQSSPPGAATNTPGDTPTPIPTATRAPTPTPVLGANKTRPIPIGSPATFENGWEITVVSTTPDATAAVLAHDPANMAPGGGEQYFMATVQVRYLGEEPVVSFAAGFDLHAVGGANHYYDFSNSCGVIADEFPSDETGPGGTLTGNICWKVLSKDVDGLVMFYHPGLGTHVTLKYLDLVP